MPKFTSSTKRIQVGNGQYVGVLFVIPVIIKIQKHRFEIFTLVSEIHENVDLVLGIKNLFEHRRCDRFTGLLFKFSKQVHTIFPKGKG